jgi:hypothetical protein
MKRVKADVRITLLEEVVAALSQTDLCCMSTIDVSGLSNVMGPQVAGIDESFLVLHCPRQEIAMRYLPALKKAAEATNVAYKQYAREQVTEDERKADVWEQRRKTMEDMAKSLKCE